MGAEERTVARMGTIRRAELHGQAMAAMAGSNAALRGSATAPTTLRIVDTAAGAAARIRTLDAVDEAIASKLGEIRIGAHTHGERRAIEQFGRVLAADRGGPAPGTRDIAPVGTRVSARERGEMLPQGPERSRARDLGIDVPGGEPTGGTPIQGPEKAGRGGPRHDGRGR